MATPRFPDGRLIIGWPSMSPCVLCAGFSDGRTRRRSRTPVAGVREAPRHEVAGDGSPSVQRELWGFVLALRVTAQHCGIPVAGGGIADLGTMRRKHLGGPLPAVGSRYRAAQLTARRSRPAEPPCPEAGVSAHSGDGRCLGACGSGSASVAGRWGAGRPSCACEAHKNRLQGSCKLHRQLCSRF